MIQILGAMNDDLKAFDFNLLELHLSRANILNDCLCFVDRVVRLDDDGGTVLATDGAVRTKLDNTSRAFVKIERVDTIVGEISQGHFGLLLPERHCLVR